MFSPRSELRSCGLSPLLQPTPPFSAACREPEPSFRAIRGILLTGEVIIGLAARQRRLADTVTWMPFLFHFATSHPFFFFFFFFCSAPTSPPSSPDDRPTLFTLLILKVDPDIVALQLAPLRERIPEEIDETSGESFGEFVRDRIEDFGGSWHRWNSEKSSYKEVWRSVECKLKLLFSFLFFNFVI